VSISLIVFEMKPIFFPDFFLSETLSKDFERLRSLCISDVHSRIPLSRFPHLCPPRPSHLVHCRCISAFLSFRLPPPQINDCLGYLVCIEGRKRSVIEIAIAVTGRSHITAMTSVFMSWPFPGSFLIYARSTVNIATYQPENVAFDLAVVNLLNSQIIRIVLRRQQMS